MAVSAVCMDEGGTDCASRRCEGGEEGWERAMQSEVSSGHALDTLISDNLRYCTPDKQVEAGVEMPLARCL